MSKSRACAVQMFTDLFQTGAAIYQQVEQNHRDVRDKASLRVLQYEKRHALKLVELSGIALKQYPLTDHQYAQLLAILEHYSHVTNLESLVHIERRLLECLHMYLASLTPSELSLNLRKIAVRQQQCLEKLNAS